jgi:hypothetical protein
VLTQFFVGLWPKKKVNMPATDLRKLASIFDTAEDPILSMKSRSVKWGAEGAIALAYSHGEEVDWEKVSSSRVDLFQSCWVMRHGVDDVNHRPVGNPKRKV